MKDTNPNSEKLKRQLDVLSKLREQESKERMKISAVSTSLTEFCEEKRKEDKMCSSDPSHDNPFSKKHRKSNKCDIF